MRIELTLPPSANELYLTVFPKGRKPRRVKSAAYKSWQEVNAWPLRNSLPKPYPFGDAPVRVIITIKGGVGFDDDGPHGRDVASCEKAVTDLLVSCAVIKDDKARYVRENRQIYLPPEGDEKATCFVEIFPVGTKIDCFARR